MSKKPIELSEFIAGLRSELEKAAFAQIQRKKSGKGSLVPDLLVKEIELEVEVVTTRSTTGEGKLSYLIAAGGIEVGKNSSTTQKITVRLTPERDLPMGETKTKKKDWF